MPEPEDDFGPRGIDALKARLATIRERQPEIEHAIVTEVVRAVLTTISHELTAKETNLLREVEELGQTIAQAKAEIATLRVDDITGHDIPFATDELDAIVDHTAQATNAILESCELLDEVGGTVSGESATKLQAATTKIYEACSFQDITGQRITKVVTTLKTIETKVAQIIGTFGAAAGQAQRQKTGQTGTDDDLLNGPQLPAHAMDQSDIDKLMASFE
jgi:chemotaxis protein CheZ